MTILGIKMGHYDTTNAADGSTDLYSRIKLRASNRKVRSVANDVYADEVTVKESHPYYRRRSETKQMNCQFADVQDFDMSDLMSDEGTAMEMRDALRKESPDIGDLVWGRVKSYPWWPGQIFDEALASPSVQSNKTEGGILVAFYGDNTYAWLDPREIVPFDINFHENLKQTNVQAFLTGVKEAIAEIKRRVALGLVCHCQSNSNLQFMMMEGNSFKQIQKAREDFCPQEIIYFLRHLALSPRKNVKQNPYWIKNVANIFAYRKAVIKEFDETDAQDFKEQHKSLECPAGITRDNQMASRDAEAEVKTNCFAPLTEVCDIPKKDELNVRHGCLSTKNFEDHELQITCEESKYFRQEGPYDLHKFSAKRRAVEYDIYSRGRVARSDRAKDLGDIPKDSSQHSSTVIPSSEVQMIRHQVEISPSNVKTCPGDASRYICCSSEGLPEKFRPNDLANAGNKCRISGHLEEFGMERPVRMNKLEYLARFASNQQKTYPGDASRNIRCSSKGSPEQFRPNDMANAGNKHRISGHLEEFGMERQVRMNKLKSLAGFASNQQVLELQGESQTGIRSGSSTPPQKDSQTKQESTRRDVKERTLTIKFPLQIILPSVSEVKAKFACFGPLDEYSTRFFWKSSTYQLVFQHKSDAEEAYRHAIQNSALFFTSEVRYYLQASDHDSNESGNFLGQIETQEESQLNSSLNSNEFASEPMSASFQPSFLLPEKNQLKSPLEKLSAESSDCPSIIELHSLGNHTDNSEIPVPLSFPSNFPRSSTITITGTTNEQCGIKQVVEDIKEHCQVEAKKNNDSQNTTIANNIDISHQLINLLSSCGGILNELRSAYEHMF